MKIRHAVLKQSPLGVRIHAFQKKIYDHFKKHGRDFPWRKTRDPYHIFVSEVMLQQTGVARVEKKFPEFIQAFPNFKTLSRVPLARVLALWQGMGYNRRAIALKSAADIVMKKYKGRLPQSVEALDDLPGIGMHTAGSICAFAFNLPAVFIETNIRAVFIHEFFPSSAQVSDREIIPLVEQTLDRVNPRLWYYALMDYGVMLKKKYANPSRRSAHYHAQSKFEGSHRQVRGMILKTLVANKKISLKKLFDHVTVEPARIHAALDELKKEGFLAVKENCVRLV